MAIEDYLEKSDIGNQFVRQMRRSKDENTESIRFHNPYNVTIPSKDEDDSSFLKDVDEAGRALENTRKKLAEKFFGNEELKELLNLKNDKDALNAVDEYIDYRIGDSGGFPEGDYPEEYKNYVKWAVAKKVLERNYGLTKDSYNYAPNVYGGIADYMRNKRADKAAKESSPEDEYVEIVINPGDTFGQKIIDSGLATNHGLWGDDGDVAYYVDQLRKNGALSDPNIIDYGQTFKIAKRK